MTSSRPDSMGHLQGMDAGQGNRVYQNITNSTITDNSKTYNIGNIETAQFVYQSLDYQALMERIAEKQEMVQYLQETGQTERALKAAAELEELEKQREQFKENVFRLYETFTRIEINTERLAQAKAHFDRGEFREADAILNAADMARDLTQLIERDQQLDREKAEIEQHRTQLANEYLIKAQLRAINFEEPNRFEQSCDYFEEALRAARTPEIAFAHAKFLQEHYCFDRAKPLYQEVLQIFQDLAKENPGIFLPNVAMTLNNLAILQADQNDFSGAEQNYQEALQIYRDLAKENPRTFLPNVAATLLNLSIFYLQAHPDRERSLSLATEVLEIAQQFPQVPAVQNYAALAIRVLEASGVDPETYIAERLNRSEPS